MKNKEFDIIICVGPQHQEIVQKTINAIFIHFEFDNLWIIANQQIIKNIQEDLTRNKKIKFISEDSLIPNVTINTLNDYFLHREQDTNRAGWYYQQFLKMQMSSILESSYYLIWDADTIPLQRIDFFDNDSALIQTSSEYHKPYFETLSRLLKLEKALQESFITEHMMVMTSVMNNLIQEIQSINPSKPWPLIVLDNIDNQNLSKSGFSEYETYGTYLWKQTSSKFKLREQKLKTYRHGTQLFSSTPSTQALLVLKDLEFAYVTFEVWDTGKRSKLRKNTIKANLYAILADSKLAFLAKKILQSFKTK